MVEDQGKGMLCHRIGGIAAYVADGHAVRLRRSNINIVIPCGTLAHIAQVRTLVKQFRRDGRFVAQHCIGIAHTLRQLFRAVRS